MNSKLHFSIWFHQKPKRNSGKNLNLYGMTFLGIEMSNSGPNFKLKLVNKIFVLQVKIMTKGQMLGRQHPTQYLRLNNSFDEKCHITR